MSEQKMQHKVQNLILDAGPLITQPASQLQQLADSFFTTPGVYNELKDETVRNQLIVWGDTLKVRHPKKASIDAVVHFAKLTGDSTVLSQNDLHIIALAYEIDVESNNGICRLRKYPGEIREEDRAAIAEAKHRRELKAKELQQNDKSGVSQEVAADVEENEEEANGKQFDADGFEIVTRKSKKGRKPKQEPKVEPQTEPEIKEVSTENTDENANNEANEEKLEAEYDEDDDCGDWITPDNIAATIAKEEDSEEVEAEATSATKSPCALASGDFAVQNVALQLGMNLMNTMSGLQIRRLRNYMLRCHACFALVPIPKDNTPKHFCPSCGGATLRRVAVSVNSETGKITPHLKKNFQWRTRGNVFSMPSPLSKNTSKKYGNKGYQHRGNDKMDVGFFSEDQREYQQAIKNAKWQQRQNEKAFEDFIGGGSADNFVSPFFTGADVKQVHVRVGKGRFANQSRKKH